MRGIENGWQPLGQLFADDNSERGSPMRSARRRGYRAVVECSTVARLRSRGTMSNADQSDAAASAAASAAAAGLHWTFAGR